MTDKIRSSAKFIDNFTNQHCGKAEDIISSDKAIDIFKWLKVIDTRVKQSPVFLPDDAAELFLDQASCREARTRVGQALALGTPDGALHAQLELLDVERLGNVVVCSQFQSLQFITSL